MTDFKMTERKWRQLNQKIENIQSQLVELERNLPKKAKIWLKFAECVPPVEVCKSTMSMMDGINTYEGFLGRLADYYGCENMGFTVNENLDPKYLAVYNPILKHAYSRLQQVSKANVLHEWFHHLVNLHVVIVPKEQEEEYATKYVEVFMQRALS